MTLSDGYGLYTLAIGYSKKMKYRGGGGSLWSGVDSTVEAVGGRELEIARRRGF